MNRFWMVLWSVLAGWDAYATWGAIGAHSNWAYVDGAMTALALFFAYGSARKLRRAK